MNQEAQGHHQPTLTQIKPPRAITKNQMNTEEGTSEKANAKESATISNAFSDPKKKDTSSRADEDFSQKQVE